MYIYINLVYLLLIDKKAHARVIMLFLRSCRIGLIQLSNNGRFNPVWYVLSKYDNSQLSCENTVVMHYSPEIISPHSSWPAEGQDGIKLHLQTLSICNSSIWIPLDSYLQHLLKVAKSQKLFQIHHIFKKWMKLVSINLFVREVG